MTRNRYGSFRTFSRAAARQMKADDDAITCRSCRAPADDFSPYCNTCASYWRDVDAGMFQEDYP